MKFHEEDTIVLYCLYKSHQHQPISPSVTLKGNGNGIACKGPQQYLFPSLLSSGNVRQYERVVEWWDDVTSGNAGVVSSCSPGSILEHCHNILPLNSWT